MSFEPFKLSDDKEERNRQLFRAVGLDVWKLSNYSPSVWAEEVIGDFLLFCTQFETYETPEEFLTSRKLHYSEFYFVQLKDGFVTKEPHAKSTYFSDAENGDETNGRALHDLNLMALKLYRMLYRK